MTRKLLIAVSLAALLASCNQGEAGNPGKADAAAAETNKLMKEIVDPQAQILWRAAGSYSDESGDHQLRPTTEEGWKATQDGRAATLMTSCATARKWRAAASESTSARNKSVFSGC